MTEKIDYKGMIIKIEQDAEPLDPRDGDSLGKMYCWHRRYTLGDENPYRAEDFDGWNALVDHIITEEDAVVMLSLYLYDHSGISIRASEKGSGNPFLGRAQRAEWDSMQVGIIIATRKNIKDFLGIEEITPEVIQKVKDILIAEVNTYNAYLTGNVWGYGVYDENDEFINSTWGFSGDEGKMEAIQEAKDDIDYEIMCRTKKAHQEAALVPVEAD